VGALWVLGRELVLLAVVVAFLLVPLHEFLRLRLRHADARPDGPRYVPATDRWIPAVLSVSGAGLIALLAALR
jgi:hypothetical protein